MKLLLIIKKLISKYFLLIEFCYCCGVRQPLVWWCKDEQLWKEVTEYKTGNGILCPKCFDKKANKKGIAVRWLAVEEYRF